jgi:hypothetical protein
MKRLTIPILTATLLLATALIGTTTAAARECTVEGKCADISISGHAEPQPIRKGGKTTLKLTAKNNGEVQSYGNWVQVTVPAGLNVKRQTIEGDGKDYGCSDNGYGFVKCYTGDLSKNEVSVVKIRVKAKKKGTFIIPAQAYADGSTSDPNGGNNQVSITVGVGRR